MLNIVYDEKMQKIFQERLGFVKNEADTIELVNISNFLTPKGFEIYVGKLLEKELGFITFNRGGFKDKGLDIVGKKINEKGEEEYLVVQCKRWNSGHIHLDDLSAWYGQVADLRMQHNIFLVFATTTWLTPHAKSFAKEKRIYVCDYRKIINKSKKYCFEQFYRDICADANYKVKSIFSSYFLELNTKTTEYKKEKKLIIEETREKIEEIKEIKEPKAGLSARMIFLIVLLSLALSFVYSALKRL